MRYHISCEGELGGGSWRIQPEQGAEEFRINGGKWATDGSFIVADVRGSAPTHACPRRTWRHRVFDLFRTNELVAVVRTSLRSGIRAEFVWEMPGPDTLELRGDFDELNYRFVRGLRTVGVVSTLEEHEGSFCIEVLPCEDQSLILAAALAVRCLCAESCGVQGRPGPAPRVEVSLGSESMGAGVRVAG